MGTHRSFLCACFTPEATDARIVMFAWDVRIGPIWNQRDAEKKAKTFIDAHPGLKWNGHWNTTELCRMSVIRVQSLGPVDVEIGPIWNQRDAEKKAPRFLKKFPYLRWTGHWRTTVPGKMSVIQVDSKPFNERLADGVLLREFTVPIRMRLSNSTDQRVTRLAVEDVDECDWGERQPNRFLERAIDARSFIEEELDLNYWSCCAPLNVKFIFESGAELLCDVDARVAIDAAKCNKWEWTGETPEPTESAVLLLADGNVHGLEIVLCKKM